MGFLEARAQARAQAQAEPRDSSNHFNFFLRKRPRKEMTGERKKERLFCV